MNSTMNKIIKVVDDKIDEYNRKQTFYEKSGCSSALYDSILRELHDVRNRITSIIKEEEDGSKSKKKKN